MIQTIEPKFMSKEDIIKCEQFIERDKNKLSELKENFQNCRKILSNKKYDLVIFPEKRELKEQVKLLEKDFTELKEKIEFYTLDIVRAENQLKQDKKDFAEYERKKYKEELQNRTLPAERQNEPYTEEEVREIIKCDYDDEEMVLVVKKFKRTYYGVEHIVRFKELILNEFNLSAGVRRDKISTIVNSVIGKIYKQ